MSFARKEEAYNGWTNYETWCAALWIGNEPGTYEHSRELTRDAIRRMDKIYGSAAGELALMLKLWVERDMVPDLGASFAADMLGAAISEVNWHEIAESYISDED